MSNTYSSSFISVVADGANIATGAASASATIPNDNSGSIPRFVRVVATAAAYVKLGKGSATATNVCMMVQPGDAVVMATLGNDKIAALQVSAAGVVQVSPLENQ